jgi:hypothetical protein
MKNFANFTKVKFYSLKNFGKCKKWVEIKRVKIP